MAKRHEPTPPEEGPGAPPQVTPKRLGDYLDVMSKAVFQAGMSWRVVEKKWAGTREAFHGFDCERVALMSDRDIDKLTKDERVIRNRRKLVAVVENANRLLELEREHGTFRKYLRSFGDYETLVKDLRKRFKFLGDMGCYYFLYVVKEKVPEYHEWREAHPMQRHR
jgi:3-methyladenine DNA glycosylase Tag